MMNPIGAQQQQAAAAFSIEQFLCRAISSAKLLEKHALGQLMVQPEQFSTGAMEANDRGAFPSPFLAKLGEDYQERLLVSKMRTIFPSGGDMAQQPNSTGSSRRSSPLSAAQSSPNSPDVSLAPPMGRQFLDTTALLPTTSTALHQEKTAAASSPQQLNMAPDTAQPSGGAARRCTTSRQSRAAHNELEKNRRANLRGHLDALKAVLPPEADTQQRDTTLSLLTRARNHIKCIKERKDELLARRAAMVAEHLRLKGQQQQQLLTEGFNCAVKEDNGDGIVSANSVQQQSLASVPVPAATNKVVQRNSQRMMAAPMACTAAPLFSSVTTKSPTVDIGRLEIQGLLSPPLLYPYNKYALMVPAQQQNC